MINITITTLVTPHNIKNNTPVIINPTTEAAPFSPVLIKSDIKFNPKPQCMEPPNIGWI